MLYASLKEKMTKKIMKRQGDLLFIKTNRTTPKGKKQNSKDILKSSITGHSHTLTKGSVYVNEPTWQDKANFYLEIETDVQVVHQEHRPISLDKGIWEVRRQQEVNGYVAD